jgi:potassium/hydrogen antiporter
VRITVGVDAALFLGAALVLAAVVISALMGRFATRLRVPGALLFLILGMLAGEDALGLVPLDDFELVQNIGVVALLFILLEGGLTTKPTDLRLAALPGTLLATVGVLVTASVTGACIWLVLDVDPVTAGLIGAVVASTDAAAVFSMMRTTPLPRRVAALLRVESGSNDPIAVMLTVGLLATVEQAATPAAWAWFAVVQLVGGAAVGALVGYGGVVLMRRLHLGIEGLYPIAVATFGALAYGAAAFVGASGFVAVYVTGLLVGALLPRHRRSVLGFHEAIANAAEIGLFLLLGLLVLPSRLPAVAPQALLVAVVVTFVARPLAIWLCTLRQRYDWRQRVALTVAGFKGAVPIVLATFPLTAGIDDAALVFDIFFFVVLVSVLVQGLALLPVIKLLDLEDPQPAWSPVAEALPLEDIAIDVVEVHITDQLRIAGRSIAEVAPPTGVVIAAVVRNDKVVVPDGSTMMQLGDVLLLTSQRDTRSLQRITHWARGENEDDP